MRLNPLLFTAIEFPMYSEKKIADLNLQLINRLISTSDSIIKEGLPWDKLYPKISRVIRKDIEKIAYKDHLAKKIILWIDKECQLNE